MYAISAIADDVITYLGAVVFGIAREGNPNNIVVYHGFPLWLAILLELAIAFVAIPAILRFSTSALPIGRRIARLFIWIACGARVVAVVWNVGLLTMRALLQALGA